MIFAVNNVHAQITYEQSPQETLIKIPLSAQVNYTIENIDNELSFKFSSPVAKQFENIKQQLPNLIASTQISKDQKNVSLTLSNPMKAQNLYANGVLTVKLQPQKKITKSKVLNNHILKLSYKKEPDVARFIFEFDSRHKPLYKLKATNDTTTIIFEHIPQLQTTNLEQYKSAGKILQQTNNQGGLNIVFPAKIFKTFEHKNKIVLDFIENDQLSEAPNTNSSLDIARASEQTSKANTLLSQEISSSTSLSPNKVASLSISWNMPVGLSVFSRNSYIWIIFDHPQNLDIAQLQKSIASVGAEVLQIPHPSATILRVRPKSKLNASVRREGLLWIVDLFTKSHQPEVAELPIFSQTNLKNQQYLFIPTSTAGESVTFVDPEIGDFIIAGTNTELGKGMPNGYSYPDLTLLPATQGIAFTSDTIDIALNHGTTGYTIQAIGRGLNISPDLAQLKHQKELSQIDNKIARFSDDFDQSLFEKSFIEAENKLKQDIIKADAQNKNNAHLDLAKYYIAQGMGTNALHILNRLKSQQAPETQTERFYGMSAVAHFLAGHYKDSIENLSFGQLPEITEAVFWRTLALSALNPSQENNAVLQSYLNIVRKYPPEIRGAIAHIGAVNAITAGDDITAQSFIDILKTIKTTRQLNPLIHYLTAEKILMQGYPRNAIQEYRKAAKSHDLKYSSLARKKITELEIRLKLISPAKAIKKLEGLRFAWGEPEFKRKTLETLSQLYVRDHNYYQALTTLEELKNLVPTNQTAEVEDKMIKLVEDIYLNNQADNISALKSLALYEDFKWLPPKSKHYNAIIQKLADRLVAVDLLNRAFNLLHTHLQEGKLSPLEKATYGSRLALIELFNEHYHEALELLNKTESPRLPQTISLQRRIVRAKALAGTGQSQQALNLLKTDYSKNALLLKTEILWKGKMWAGVADTLKYLIEKPQPDKPLTTEQINYILDWATALKQAGRETVIVRLRNSFMPYFEKTKYYSAFSVLTNTFENDKINIRTLDKAIDDIKTFSNFAKIYNTSLINSSLGTYGEHPEDEQQ